MNSSRLVIHSSGPLEGEVSLMGAKNAVLVIMASLLLTKGKSTLHNVPGSADVLHMCTLLESLGARVTFVQDEQLLIVDTTGVNDWQVDSRIMKKMRASVLVMGPLLARFGRADIALPGGCIIGARPIDYHLKGLAKMGVTIQEDNENLLARCDHFNPAKIVLEYPSVGATENIMMAATLTPGTTKIINAAIEPEVIDLITVLKKMGANITINAPATICIEGVKKLRPIEHTILPDRLEGGVLLLAGAITGGYVTVSDLPVELLDVFLAKLDQMGHTVIENACGVGVRIKGTKQCKAVSFKTAPFPGFPTDLQAPMMAAQLLANGTSVIEEMVFENRLVHARELVKMGAQISVEGNKATVSGVDELFGASVIATDIRASAALVLAGLVASGPTIMTGLHHWRRGYQALEEKLTQLGADIKCVDEDQVDVAVTEQSKNRVYS